MRRAGLDVQLLVAGPLPVGTSHTVYRLVQEALTNAVKHAPGARVAIRVLPDPRVVTVDVVDDGPGPRPDGRPGHGLIGLAERVDLAGGTFLSGPRPNGSGFRIRAQLPQTLVTSESA